jgi:hypothetical protein
LLRSTTKNEGQLKIATNEEIHEETLVVVFDRVALNRKRRMVARYQRRHREGCPALEQQWLQSQKTNNPDLVAPLLADKFITTGSDGKVNNKTESLATAKATKYTSVDYDDMKVTVFGDTAIATGGFKGKGTDPSGKAMDVTERFTDTWVKMPNGKWQCVASHVSSVKM